MSKVETIKSALKFLVQKQIEQGSHGFSDNNDDEVSWKETLEWIEQPIDKSAMMYEIYMEGEYQGCWVRFKNIEKIVNKYMAESEDKV